MEQRFKDGALNLLQALAYKTALDNRALDNIDLLYNLQGAIEGAMNTFSVSAIECRNAVDRGYEEAKKKLVDN